MEVIKTKVSGDIWSNLLSDISSSTSSAKRLQNTKNILILGDELSGKSSLVAKLQDQDDLEMTHYGLGLDFDAIEVKREDDVEEDVVCRVWSLDGQLAHRGLLHFALPEDLLEDSLVMLTVDMSQPWNMFDSLSKWLKVLHEYIDSLKLNVEVVKRLQHKVLLDYQSYVDPADTTADEDVKIESIDEAQSAKNLGEKVLVDNLGLPIIVVCTKCDQIEGLEAEQDYKEECFDYIQYNLRKFCIEIGAGLCYVSIKENKNIELLKNYLFHKLWGFKFDGQASVVDRETVFVPSGWDSEKKIQVLSDTCISTLSLTDKYENVITKPSITRKFVQDMKELVVDDEQTFLKKSLKILQNKAPKSFPTNIAGGEPASFAKRTDLPTNPSMMTKNKVDATKVAGNNEKMLANFFNSLLSKKVPNSATNTPPKKSSD